MRRTPAPRPGTSRGPRHAATLALVAAAILGAVIALLPRPALAAGRVTITSRDLTEADGRWKLKMTIDYGSIPQLPHIPMIFSFTPTVHYERALTDKSPDKPILVRQPLQNQQSINESMDVGFSDGSGKVFKITKFDFVIRRDHGFEAGEYELKIKREDDGVQMGPTMHLTLKGDNPVVDRRAIVFAGDKPKSKKADADSADDKKDAPAADDKEGGGEVPKVPPKQGGCGCKVAGDAEDAPGGAVLLALGAVVALAGRRRRRA